MCIETQKHVLLRNAYRIGQLKTIHFKLVLYKSMFID